MKKILILLILIIPTHIYLCQAQEIYTLDKCKELASENNVKIKNANLNVQLAQQTRKEAFTHFFPEVKAQGGTFRTDNGIVGFKLKPLFPDVEIDLIDQGTAAGVTAVMPLFAGGQILNGNKLARVGEEVSRYQLQQTEDEVELTVEQYYWQYVSLREKVKTIRIAEELIEKTLKDVTLAVQVGVVERNDLLQVEIKQNEIASNRLQLNNGIHLSKLVLAQYIGVPADSFDIVAPGFDALPLPATLSVNHDEALPNTINYKLLDKNVEASAINKQITTGKYLPTVGLGAGYMYHDIIQNNAHSFGVIFATASIPISGWWGGSHEIKKQKIQTQIAEQQRQDAHELLLIQMQKYYNDLEENYQQVLLAEKNIEKADENLRLNSDYYMAGTVTINDLLTAQSLLQQTRDQYVTSYTDYLMKVTQYLQATGR